MFSPSSIGIAPSVIRSFLLTILNLILQFSMNAQPIDLLKMADRLSQQNQFSAAIAEYKRFLFFHPESDTSAFLIYRGIATAYRGLRDWNQSIRNFQIALSMASNDETYNEISVDIAVTYFAAGRTDDGLLELDRLLTAATLPQTLHNGLSLKFAALVTKFQWSQAKIVYESLKNTINGALYIARGREVDSLLLLGQNYSPYSETTARWLSTIIPGLGQLYVGDIKNSLNALALNTIVGYGAFQNFINRAYLESVLLFGAWIPRYYLGNRYRAELLAQQKNLDFNSSLAEQILDIHFSTSFPANKNLQR